MFSFTDSIKPSHASTNGNTDFSNYNSPSIVARENLKNSKYGPLTAARKADFYPFVVERSTMAIGQKAESLCLRMSKSGNADRSFLIRMSIVCAAVRAIAKMLKLKLHRDQRGILRRTNQIIREDSQDCDGLDFSSNGTYDEDAISSSAPAWQAAA